MSKSAPSETTNPPSAEAPAQGGLISNTSQQPESSTGPKKSIWINSWYDPLASVCTPSQNMCFSNINNDGDYKLVTATSTSFALSRGCATLMDLETKSKSKPNHLLKVFSGPNLLTKNVLISDISGVASFFIDYNNPRRPVIAVACGEFLFLYKNMQPFYRFVLPIVDIPAKEVEIWTDLMNGNLQPEKGYKDILELRNSGAKISTRSKEVLSLSGRENILKFIEERKKFPLSIRSFITCMETIRKDQPEGECIHSLILGTEDGMVHILNQTCTKILSSFQLPSPPAIIKAIGVLDVDHRIIIGCRDAKIYQIRNGALSAISLAIETPIVALEFIDKKNIAVVSMKNCIHVFHPKGQKQYTLYFDVPIKSICVLQLTGFSLGTNILCVALENKEIRIYKGKQLIETTTTVEEVVGLQFGTYGTEANTLVLSYRNGALEFKNISRRAQFDTPANTPGKSNGTPKEQEEPLEGLPVKTKLALEFMKREREEATEMHREFQRELCKLKVTTARSYVKILTDGEGQISFAESNNLRVHANVQGLGPLFKIKFLIQNTSNKTLMKIPVVFAYNQNIYKIKRARMVIPCLIPGLKYQFSIDVYNIDSTATDGIKLLVCRPTSPKPLITCLINMPMSEPM